MRGMEKHRVYTTPGPCNSESAHTVPLTRSVYAEPGQ